MSRAVIGTRGWSFLSERAYEKYGTTAVMRLAEARFRASIMISSSRIESLTSGYVGWTMKTSCSRTFWLILGKMFSFENLTTSALPSGTPR